MSESEKMKHTPGPWRVYVDGPLIDHRSIHTAGGHPQLGGPAPIVSVGIGIHGCHVVIHPADSELIALAPTAPHDCDNPHCPGVINQTRLQAFEALTEPRPFIAWHEDVGPVLWWHLTDGQIQEPPWIGTPLDDAWSDRELDGYYTIWTPIQQIACALMAQISEEFGVE